MDPKIEGQEPHNPPAEPQVPPTKVEISAAELEDLKKKAEASSQNFERLKKIEAENKELEGKLKGGEPTTFDSAALEKKVEDKVSLRLSGHTPAMIEEIERYAKGAGISLSEAAKSPFVQKAVEALRAEAKSQDNTPAPSNNVKSFNGKPVEEIFKSGTADEKQAAFEARIRGGAKSNE